MDDGGLRDRVASMRLPQRQKDNEGTHLEGLGVLMFLGAMVLMCLSLAALICAGAYKLLVM